MAIYPSIYSGPPKNYTARVTRKKYIAIHNTSNNASAEAEASYATRRTDSVSSHYYVDNDSIVQSLDTNYRAWHSGSTAGNDLAIAYEITGTNDKNRQWWLSNVAWLKMCRQMAIDCKTHGIAAVDLTLNQIKSGVSTGFITHDEMRLAWGGTTHTDPGSNFPMDHLIATVNSYLGVSGTSGGVDMSISDVVPATGNRSIGVCMSDIWNAIATGHSGYVPTQSLYLNAQVHALQEMLKVVAAKVDIDPAELAAISEAAKSGAKEGVVASADSFAAAVLAKLSTETLTKERVKEAIKEVFGALDEG